MLMYNMFYNATQMLHNKLQFIYIYVIYLCIKNRIMKEKIELKHLAPYLPYGLKAVKGVTRIEITSVSLELPHVYHTSYLGSRLRVVSLMENIKPILRPLSDLTKEIEHNGEKFVFSDVYLSNAKIKKILGKDYSTFNDFLNDVDYNSIQLLFKYHFDVFGLIDKGLSVDINTLEK